ncbi:HmuY family protein [Sorangium sp. So ce131]|uniref:HmuY family protein n=1 Tax=Sorangium sp. So ce131 TaxID=3133282 RepID=UPI003F61ED09
MSSSRTSTLLAAAGVLLALSACGSDEPVNPVDTGNGGAGGAPTGEGGSGGSGGGGAPAARCAEPTPVACEDDVFQQMGLQDTVSSGEVSSAADGDGFRSSIDASAGGAFADDEPYVYARFTDGGLEKVEISDEQSLTSMDWDIAFRRYLVRINSGHSGPSCVAAARLAGTPDYDALTAVPDNARFRNDEYFTESCELITDGSGLNGPATALSGYWDYSMCLAMSGTVYILALADDRKLKLTVTHYYDEENQAECNETGMVSDTASAAHFQVRWAFLP